MELRSHTRVSWPRSTLRADPEEEVDPNKSVDHSDSLAQRPIDPGGMGNSFGSYSEPGTRNNCQAEASPPENEMMTTSRPNSDGGRVRA